MRRANDCYDTALKKMEGHKVIKAMRLYLGYTQEEVAKKAGISPDLYWSYENVPGLFLRGGFSEVCRILKILHLNPRKFYQGKYVLNDAGHKAVSKKCGPLNRMLRKSLQQCCPVSCKKGRNENGGT